LEVELSGQLMLLGLPMAFQNFIIAIGSMIVQRLINSFGVIFIAGFTATNKLYGVLEIAATSYGFAMVTYTGQNLGANQPKEFAMITGCVLLLPLWLGEEGIFYAEVLAWTGADLVLIPSCIWALRHRLTKSDDTKRNL